jgi:hypothetical protein
MAWAALHWVPGASASSGERTAKAKHALSSGASVELCLNASRRAIAAAGVAGEWAPEAMAHSEKASQTWRRPSGANVAVMGSAAQTSSATEEE